MASSLSDSASTLEANADRYQDDGAAAARELGSTFPAGVGL